MLPHFLRLGSVYIKLLSCDQASAISGCAVFENQKLVKYNLIDLHGDKDSVHRLHRMIIELGKIIIKEKPDMVVFEDVSLQTNVATLMLLSQIQGALIYICASNEIQYKVYKPTTWRKILKFRQNKGIKRPELKQQAKDYVKNKYDLILKEDICDAICIGEAYIKENIEKED